MVYYWLRLGKLICNTSALSQILVVNSHFLPRTISKYFECVTLILTFLHISMVCCQKGTTRHAYPWQIGPFWWETFDIYQISDRSVSIIGLTHVIPLYSKCYFSLSCKMSETSLKALFLYHFDRGMNLVQIYGMSTFSSEFGSVVQFQIYRPVRTVGAFVSDSII